MCISSASALDKLGVAALDFNYISTQITINMQQYPAVDTIR